MLRDNDQKRKVTEAVKERRRSKYTKIDNTTTAREAYTRHDDGIEPDEVTDDVPPDYWEEMKTSYYNTKVTVTETETQEIEL